MASPATKPSLAIPHGPAGATMEQQPWTAILSGLPQSTSDLLVGHSVHCLPTSLQLLPAQTRVPAWLTGPHVLASLPYREAFRQQGVSGVHFLHAESRSATVADL